MRNRSLILSLSLLVAGCTQQPPAEVIAARPNIQRTLAQNTLKPQLRIAPKPTLVKPSATWIWPAKGPAALALKGLDIAGADGSPVYAANNGEVVYSGNSLRGYGNLIIIKHSNYFLSAYAHNRKNMVKEGERVSIGQKIAEMGQSGTNKVKLHFEVRYKGKPIDPYEVLPSK